MDQLVSALSLATIEPKDYSAGLDSFFARCLLVVGRVALARSADLLRCK